MPKKKVKDMIKELQRCPDHNMEVVIKVPHGARPGEFVPISHIGLENIQEQDTSGDPAYNEDRDVITICG